MKVFWIAGEPSGDVQASALVAALQHAVPDIEQAGWGGTHMAAAGMKQLYDLPNESIMGFVEVAKKVPAIVRQLSQIKSDIQSFGAQIIVLVDYAGFNLRIAQWASIQGIKVVYFIPPKVWAWKESRLKPLSRYSDLILSILPFEETWYSEKGVQAHYVGNPLMERYANSQAFDIQSKRILLLPGSRMQEVTRLMPVFAALAKAMPEYTFDVVRAASLRDRWPSHEGSANLKLIDASLAEAAHSACFALTCSGTASLEIALLGIPQAVVYRANPISLAIAKQLVKVKYFSLPNLIMDEAMVPEFLQDEVRVDFLKPLVLEGGVSQIEDIKRLQRHMGAKNLAADAVPLIVNLLHEK